jgi:hypothetical protein
MKPADPKLFLPTDVPASEGLKWEGHMADDVASTYGPEPMAVLLASADSLYLSSSRGNFRIPRSAVVRLGRGNFYPWFFSALRIHHQVAGYPRSLQFKPLHTTWRQVIAELKQLGFPTT